MAEISVITSEDVLEALRLWHGGEVRHWPLAHMRLRLQTNDHPNEYSTLAASGPAAQNRSILNRGLELLKSRSPDAEDLLRERFENRRDVLSLANSLNVSESSLYYRQRQAVQQLTEILLQIEESASIAWQEKMLSRLPLPSYTELIGIEKVKQTLLEAITHTDDSFIIAIDGLGGIGKTALADQIARDLIKTTRFDEIAWVTAKHTHLSTLGRLQIESGRPALTFTMLVDKLTKQFDLNDRSTQLEKQRTVKQFLQERACLVVIDNLETVADYRSLLPELRKWQQPSKFLITSRLRLLHEPGVFSISLQELEADDALKLIRTEARQTGFQALAQADRTELLKIYEAVGGNPLALKLIIGQLRFHSLPRVLARIATADSPQTREGIFDYIYQEIWDDLPDDSKITLLALTQAGESGFTFEHLVTVAGISEQAISRCLEELILLSLVDLAGTLLERRYRLHRLTELFLLRIIAEE